MTAERTIAYDPTDPYTARCIACARTHDTGLSVGGLCPGCRITAPRCVTCRAAVGPRGCRRCHRCPTEGCGTITPYRFCTDCLNQERERIAAIRASFPPIGGSGPRLAVPETDDLGYVPGVDPGARSY